jgi:LysM repeat protein
MNSHPLFSPESPASDAKQAGRSRVKIAVFSVLAVHVAALMALLMTQGCKREVPQENTDLPPEVPMMDTNTLPPVDTNTLPPDVTSNVALPPEVPLPPPNTSMMPPPTTGVTPVPMPPPTTAGGSEYVIKAGDSFYTIAKQNGTSLKAIQNANPGVDPRRLKIGQKINLPAPSAAPTTPAMPTATTGDANIYTVVSGDSLSRIASRHGTTISELKSLNNLSTDRIKVGQKLKLPPKPAPAPVVPTMPPPTAQPAPTVPPTTAPPAGQ